MNYAELQVTSNFTFMRGGSHPEELVLRAAELGYTKITLERLFQIAEILEFDVVDFITPNRSELIAATN